MREGEVTPLELTELYLRRIERLDPRLNAYVTVDAERALEAARAPREGPFAGVPISVKDLHETAGLRTTYSCRAFADHVPDFDSAVVRRLRQAGFVLLGKTNTPEFGTIAITESELNGACRNPWDVSRTPGGSSGGAAAAVAAGLSPVAQGSDGGSSIRNPASCCGLVGLKPSRGRISSAPYGGGPVGLGTSGAITRTVRDTAALLDVLAGYEPGDPWWAPPPERPFAEEPGRPVGRLRVALCVTPPVDVPVDPVCAEAARSAARLLEALGHDVVEAEPPWSSEELLPRFLCVWASLTALWSPVRDSVEPINRALIEDSDATTATELALATVGLQAHARRVVAFWNDVDVVLTPTLALPPVPVGWAFEGEEDPRAQFGRLIFFTPFTPLVNVTGQPAISLPLAESDGLPIGVQLIGPPAGDALLLRLAAQLEEARPWADPRPPSY
ncbi:MAG TPA: amidase [Gaiellaceae bacterium]|jgi:amidase